MNIMLNEKKQKIILYMIPFIWNGQKSRLMFAGRCGWKRELPANGHKNFLRGWKHSKTELWWCLYNSGSLLVTIELYA